MRNIWLDCDPGHDDAIAILLACHLENLHLFGISTVAGNANAERIRDNAARCLYAFAAEEGIKVYTGATKPLIRPSKHDDNDGLGGVQGLPSASHPDVKRRLPHTSYEAHRALEGISTAIRDIWKNGAGPQVTIIATGPLTNIALFTSVYPELLAGVEQFVFMGGGVGVGNMSATAEFNIMSDPEAAQIVLDTPVKTVMIPLNVTHTAIVTSDIFTRLRSSSRSEGSAKPITNLRHTLTTLLSFFADEYRSDFGFIDGPPVHDALAVAYVSRPDLFKSRRFRVDVELGGTHTVGETVVDMWNYRQTDDSWGPNGKNCLIAETIDASGFFEIVLECVARCDLVSPLNQ